MFILYLFVTLILSNSLRVALVCIASQLCGVGAATGATYSCAGGILSRRLSAPLADQTRQPYLCMVTGRQARYHTWSFRRILSGHPVPILVQLIAVPCYVVARRPPNYEPDCCCYLFSSSSSSSIRSSWASQNSVSLS